MDSQQVVTMFTVLQAQLTDITQTLHKSQEKLAKLETPLEDRNKRERKRDPLTPYQNDQYLTSSQLDLPTFDDHLNYFGRSDPQIFLDWLQSMDMYFIWYPIFKAKKVRFATMKLTGQAIQYWTNMKTSRQARFQQPIETQYVIKDELKDKYVPSYYYKHLVDKWCQIT